MERIKDSPIADPTVSSSVAPVVLIQNRKGGGLAMSMVEVTVVVRECVCVSRLRSAWAMSAVASQQSITTQPNFRGEQLREILTKESRQFRYKEKTNRDDLDRK